VKPFRSSPSILIVEDDEAIATCLADLLRDEGYSVATARNGRAGLALLERQAFAVILMDLAMPVMDGRALTRALREKGTHPPIVLMTANRDAPTLARELGVAAYLAKPFSIDDVLATIADLLPAQRAERVPAGLRQPLQTLATG
jgi:CheY-like chemotaxis protein